jgi:zinc transport system permease protein
MVDLFDYLFFKNAFLGIVLSSLLCGIVGSVVVVNRIVSLSGSIAHAAYGGIGLAFFFGLPITSTTMLFSSLSGLVIGILTEKENNLSDAFIAMIWAFGMALGIILIDLTPGYNADLMTYLFGNILTITTNDLFTSAILLFIIVSLFVWNYKTIVLVSFDKDYARVIGYNVKLVYYTMLVIVSITIVVLIKMTGIILVMAMLTIPQSIAIKRSRSLFGMVAISSVIALLFSLAGFFIAYRFNVSTGASIILFAVVIYFIDTLVVYVRK